MAGHEQGDLIAPGKVLRQARKAAFRFDGVVAADRVEERDLVHVVGFSRAVDDVVDRWQRTGSRGRSDGDGPFSRPRAEFLAGDGGVGEQRQSGRLRVGREEFCKRGRDGAAVASLENGFESF